MRRVYAVYIWHTLVNPVTLKLYVAAIFTIILSTSVSISHVIANMPTVTDFGAWYQFNIAAFSNTELGVKVLIGSLALLALWLLRDVMRKIVAGTTTLSGQNL